MNENFANKDVIRRRRKWSASDFFVVPGNVLEFKRNRSVKAIVYDAYRCKIQLEDNAPEWVIRTFSAAMKIADRRTRGESGGKNTPAFQSLWLYNGETLHNRRMRVLESGISQQEN